MNLVPTSWIFAVYHFRDKIWEELNASALPLPKTNLDPTLSQADTNALNKPANSNFSQPPRL